MNVLESFSSIPRVKRLAAHVWRHFGEDRLFDEAASLSYTSLLSMVPLLAVVFGVASIFPVFQEWSEQMKAFVFNNFDFRFDKVFDAGKFPAVQCFFYLFRMENLIHFSR